MTPRPTSGITVVTVEPEITATPVPTKTPAPFVEKVPSKLVDLSGQYEITFPSCFDKSSFRTGRGMIATVYESSAFPDITLTVSYTLKDMPAEKTDKASKTESVEITLPSSYFTEGAEGESPVILSVTVSSKNSASTEAFDFSITGLE